MMKGYIYFCVSQHHSLWKISSRVCALYDYKNRDSRRIGEDGKDIKGLWASGGTGVAEHDYDIPAPLIGSAY